MSNARSRGLCLLDIVASLLSVCICRAGAAYSGRGGRDPGPRKIFHVKMTVPAQRWTMTFYYPEWIPGEHGPTGPIQDLTGLFFTGKGKKLAWRRDLLDGWTFHVEVPHGVAISKSHSISHPRRAHEGIYTGGPSATDKMAVLSWNTLVLYPAGWTSDQVMFEASVRLPQGWKYGTPLPVANATGEEISFQPVSLTTLVDSPIITGEFLRVDSAGEHARGARNGYRSRQRSRARCASGVDRALQSDGHAST